MAAARKKTSRALRPLARSASGEVSIYLDGPVGFPEDGGMTEAMFREQLRTAGGAPLRVHINSDGGVVTQGMAMYTALRLYKGHKVGVVTGIAASIASVVLMGCDEIHVAKGAYIMIHNPSGAVKGGAGDMRASAELLESMRGEMLDIYAARTSIDRVKLAKMLDEETYLTAEEAVEAGLADDVIGLTARITLQAVARLDPTKVPAELRASAKGRVSMKASTKAKMKAAEEELAKLKAQAAEEGDEEEETDEDDEEEKPSDSDDKPHDEEEEDDEEKASATAIVSTVKAITGSKSGSVALGKLVALVSKGKLAAASNRAELVEAAVKTGKLLPALKTAAMGWSDKVWNSYLASMGGASALKLGPKHKPPVAKSSDESTPKAALPEAAVSLVAKAMGLKPEAFNGVPECAPQLKIGEVK